MPRTESTSGDVHDALDFDVSCFFLPLIPRPVNKLWNQEMGKKGLVPVSKVPINRLPAGPYKGFLFQKWTDLEFILDSLQEIYGL